MPPKRKENGHTDELSGRERKKQKTAAARTIAVQPGASGAAENAVAGPSRSVRFDSMKGLPGSLDVERFAEARAFEINAMHEAMQNARSNSTQRAWQQLPRHLRRRAASHDVRRVPLRLRDKARAEMDPVRRKALGRSMPKRGKAKRVNRTTELLRRQRNKTWLETHLWHAKRMKMENMWGYRLAVQPTEKSFRPSHRASIHGSILHDASYYMFIEVKGPEDILRQLLNSCCDHQGPGPGAQRFLTGARTFDTHIYKYRSYPFDLIAPVTIMWQPLATPTNSKQGRGPQAEQPAPSNGDNPRNQRAGGKGKGQAAVEGATTTYQPKPAENTRTVWVRTHPAVFDKVHEALRYSASFALEAAKNAGPSNRVAEVEFVDLREKMNIFEIMGPKSSQIIKGALKPVLEDKRADFKKFWQSLSRLQSTGSVPRGMVIGLTVYDPRLSFPPKNAKVDLDTQGQPNLSPPLSVFPSSTLAQSEIWDEDIRLGLRRPRYKKKDIDQRRSNNLVPGTPLQATQKDARIPVILIQRSIENSSSTSQSPSYQTDDSPSIHGWTLIIPQGWGMPFFSSLTYTGTRVAGQRERQTQSFEAGCAYFPRDYPSTASYDMYADNREEEDRGRWERKPPAKRTNFDKVGSRSPWKPDWRVVLGLEKPPAQTGSGGDGDAEMIAAQREDVPVATAAVPAAEGEKEKTIPHWLLRGVDVPSIIEDLLSMLNPAAGLLDHINKARFKRKQDPLDASVRADELWKGALVQVKVELCARGSPDDLAAIYGVNDEEAREWVKAETARKNGTALMDDGPNETDLSQVIPPEEAILGYVTSGNFSLSRGEGYAIGAIPIARLFELKHQARRLRFDSIMLVKVRNREELVCRAAHIGLL
ncbi:Ribonucleases P/MRP protein subunit pop1 [Grifola frondosa]|uniref:Ribonucleases P/MRP protein subunit pop1 n=1 Tax=Grifola frondosa TaxID=5627 RepID=A0A1C7M2J5_GRIFR|nr:Ribonucleases P/MRP protein subunit pop1 [Grifola frondosa]